MSETTFHYMVRMMSGKIRTLCATLALCLAASGCYGASDGWEFGDPVVTHDPADPGSELMPDDTPPWTDDSSMGDFDPGEPAEEVPTGEVPILCSGSASEFALLSVGGPDTEISLGAGVAVLGDVGAAYNLVEGAESSINGDVFVPVPAAVLLDAKKFAQDAAKVGSHKAQETLGADSIDVGSHTWVYEVADVDVPNGGVLEITGTEEGKLIVIVNGSFNFGNATKLKLDGGMKVDHVLFYLRGASALDKLDRISGGSIFQGATILAPHRTVYLGSWTNSKNDGVVFAGSVMARNVKVASASVIAGQAYGECPWQSE